MEIKDGNSKTNSHWTISFHSHRPIITVDFDHTITTNCMACKNWDGVHHLQEGVKEALIELNKKFKIIILTGGGYYVKNYKDYVKEFLTKNKIPFDEIRDDKPPAVFMIEDRAVRHIGWENTLKEIKKRMENN